jgi:hypothetical protein
MTPSLIITIAAVAGLVFIALCFVIAQIAANNAGFSDPTKRANFRDSYTKTVAQVFGGAALALTFAWTVIKDNQTAEKDSQTLSQSSQTFAQSVVSSANQQFIDAAKLMAGKAVEARAAGIYSFEKIVTAYADYLDPVSYTLLAFILQHKPDTQKHVDGSKAILVDQDVSAAVYVLGKMPIKEGNIFDLRDYYLAGTRIFQSPPRLGVANSSAPHFMQRILLGPTFPMRDSTELIWRIGRRTARKNGTRTCNRRATPAIIGGLGNASGTSPILTMRRWSAPTLTIPRSAGHLLGSRT